MKAAEGEDAGGGGEGAKAKPDVLRLPRQGETPLVGVAGWGSPARERKVGGGKGGGSTSCPAQTNGA